MTLFDNLFSLDDCMNDLLHMAVDELRKEKPDWFFIHHISMIASSELEQEAMEKYQENELYGQGEMYRSDLAYDLSNYALSRL